MEWIKANNPPKEACECLVYEWWNGHGSIQVLWYAPELSKISDFSYSRTKRDGFYYVDDNWGYVECDYITHWMPLPDPPENEAESYGHAL